MSKQRFALLIAIALCVGASAGAYKPQCKDSSGRLIVCSGTLDNAQAPTAPAMSGANITANTVPAGAIVPGTVDNTEFGYLNGVTSGIQAQIDAVNAALANYVALTGNQTIAGVKTFSAPPAMSGTGITDGTIRLDSLAAQGASTNAILRWNGTNWGITATASANALLTSGASAPAWSNTLNGIIIDAAVNSLSNVGTSMLASGFNLAANQGGTGFTSYAVGDVLAANTTSTLSKVAAGTSGHVLTANGAGVLPSYQAPVTGTTVSVTLTSTTWTSTTFVDSGQKITLPSGGLWRITTKLRNYCQVTSGAPGANSFQLYDTTAGAVVTDSQTFGAGDYIGGGSGFGTTTTWSVLVDVASGRDIRIDVKRLAGPTYSSTGWASDTTEGTSTITAVKLRS